MAENKDVDSQTIVRTIEDLVSLRTVDGNFEAFEEAVAYIKDFFSAAPVHVETFLFNRYPAIIITTGDRRRPRFFLQGHIDVVEGKDEQFSPIRAGDYLYGRGTVDMKGFDAVAMHLLRDLALSGSGVDAGLMLTFDEEIGSAHGASRLAAMGICPEILINGDGGYNYAVIHAEKGILKVKMSAQSEPGRHPYPWDGENAFDLLIKDYRRIMELFGEQNQATDLDNWHTTFSSYDVVVKNEPSFAPHYAEMKINIYFTEDLSSDELFAKIRSVTRHVRLLKLSGSERVFLPGDDKHVLRLREIMQSHFRRPIAIRSENGSSDARFFTRFNIPILIVKMVGENHHGPDERLHIPSILPMYAALKDFIGEFSMPGQMAVQKEMLHE